MSRSAARRPRSRPRCSRAPSRAACRGSPAIARSAACAPASTTRFRTQACTASSSCSTSSNANISDLTQVLRAELSSSTRARRLTIILDALTGPQEVAMRELDFSDEGMLVRELAAQPDDPDRDIIERIASDLAGALTLLRRRSGTPLSRFCREALRARALADDTHQQIFIQAHRDLARFAG